MKSKKYRPNWQRIFFLAVLLNFVVAYAVTFGQEDSAEVTIEEDLQKVDWYETTDTQEEVQEISQPTETFPEIKFPPIEIPPVPEIDLREIETEPVQPAPEKISPEEKVEMTSDNKLKVISKVLPRDVAGEMNIIGKKLSAGKIVLEVTVSTEGKVRNVEILRGGEDNFLNILATAAATRWIFEPFQDADGQPTEIKTQMEFNPADF